MADTSKYTKYKNDFNLERYDRIALHVTKGKRDVIRTYAQKQGKSINAYINGLIDGDMNKKD